jgi:hypothetical protein
MHALIASAATTVAAWILLGPLAAVVVTVTGARLLGVRRGWLQLAVAGVVGWTAGIEALEYRLLGTRRPPVQLLLRSDI